MELYRGQLANCQLPIPIPESKNQNQGFPHTAAELGPCSLFHMMLQVQQSLLFNRHKVCVALMMQRGGEKMEFLKSNSFSSQTLSPAYFTDQEEI